MNHPFTIATRAACIQLCLAVACSLTTLSNAQSPRQAHGDSPELVQGPRTVAPTQAVTLQSPAGPEIALRGIQQQSIISLAPAPKPRGAVLARFAGDATFEHVPANYHVFAAANVGEDAGVETLTLNFDGGTRLTRIDSKNKDFVVEPGGSCHEGNVYSKGDTCTLLVRFNPQGPGHRLGFVNITHSAELTPMSFGLTGNGYAPVISFTPSQITTVPVTISAGTGLVKSATNIAIDGGDIIYIADTGSNNIKEIDSSGAINTVNAFGGAPASIAVDNAGIVYTANVLGSTDYFSFYTPWLSATTYFTTYAPGTCTPSAQCPLTTVGMGSPAGMSIDAYDDLIFEEHTQGAAAMPIASVSGGTGSLSLWYLKDQYAYTSPTPGSFAADANANLYTDYTFGTSTCLILEESLYSAEYSPTARRVAGGVKCGFSGDGGLGSGAEISTKIGQIAFDIAGNMYFADAGNQRVRRIDAATGIISTIAGNGTAGYSGDGAAATVATLSNPTGVAVDSQGQVYILTNAPSAGPTQVLRKVTDTGIWNFGSVHKGTASAAKVFQVANTGNSPLTLSANASPTGANPSDFSIDPATTNCVLTAGATLGAGQSCKIGIIFKPTVAAVRTGGLVLHDNTLGGSNTILFSGTGVLPAPTFTITSPTNGSSFKTGTAVTFSVSVTSATTPAPTGTVQFMVDGANYGTAVTISGGTASTSVTGLTIATHTLSAKYSGDANYAAAGPISVSSIVTAAKVGPIMSMSTVPLAANSCSAPEFAVSVSAASGPVPTGQVNLLDGSTVVSSGVLMNGQVLLSGLGLSAGSHNLTVSYAGDGYHYPGTLSAAVSVASPPHACGIHGSSGITAPSLVGHALQRKTDWDQ